MQDVEGIYSVVACHSPPHVANDSSQEPGFVRTRYVDSTRLGVIEARVPAVTLFGFFCIQGAAGITRLLGKLIKSKPSRTGNLYYLRTHPIAFNNTKF